jgi:LemA protein
MPTRFLAWLAPLLLVLSGCGINSIPRAEEEARAKFADLQGQYQRRADLIPNLTRIVERYAQQERDVLTEVTRARASASSVQVDPTNEQQMQQFAQTQDALGQSIGRLLVTVERYPDLQSAGLFRDFMTEYSGTENRIAVARRDYNAAVQDLNTRLRTFPEMIGGSIRGVRPMVPFQAAPGSEVAPQVNFSR